VIVDVLIPLDAELPWQRQLYTCIFNGNSHLLREIEEGKRLLHGFVYTGLLFPGSRPLEWLSKVISAWDVLLTSGCLLVAVN